MRFRRLQHSSATIKFIVVEEPPRLPPLCPPSAPVHEFPNAPPLPPRFFSPIRDQSSASLRYSCSAARRVQIRQRLSFFSLRYRSVVMPRCRYWLTAPRAVPLLCFSPPVRGDIAQEPRIRMIRRVTVLRRVRKKGFPQFAFVCGRMDANRSIFPCFTIAMSRPPSAVIKENEFTTSRAPAVFQKKHSRFPVLVSHVRQCLPGHRTFHLLDLAAGNSSSPFARGKTRRIENDVFRPSPIFLSQSV